MKTLTSLIALMLLKGLPAWTQQNEAAPGAPLTIRAGAKLVVVDVVVTDKDHRRVHGLKKEDFTVAEGAARQTIRSFEEHTPDEAVVVPKPKPLPAGTFTNEEAPARSAALNVILIDVLNTHLKDQPYLRAQVAKYLGSMKPGISLAVFSLNAPLVMLQGFSSDPEILKRALEGSVATRSVLLTDEAEQGSTAYTITQLLMDAGFDPRDPSNPIGLAKMAQLQSEEDAAKARQTDVRGKFTLDGLNALARYLSGLPGRKNLIWFSGSFPVSIIPRRPFLYRTVSQYDAFDQLQSSENEFRETVNLMTKAQVAVYPVDSRGLMVSSTMNLQSSGVGSSNPGLVADGENEFFESSADEHSTMERIAHETGGRAFINTNNFSGAIESAVEDGTTFYTLSYTPSNTKWRGELRRISVRLAQAGYSLSYRHGYYADDPASLRSALVTAHKDAQQEAHGPLDESDLLRMMGHGMPPVSQVLYKARIFPVESGPEATPTNGSVAAAPGYAEAKGPFRRYRVSFQVEPRSVSLLKGEDGTYRGLMEFAAWVLNADGRRVTTISRQMQIVADAQQYEHLAGETIDFSLEASVPVKGNYSIRTGVLDIHTRNVGAMEVGIARVKDLPPVPPEANKRVLQVRPQ